MCCKLWRKDDLKNNTLGSYIRKYGYIKGCHTKIQFSLVGVQESEIKTLHNFEAKDEEFKATLNYDFTKASWMHNGFAETSITRPPYFDINGMLNYSITSLEDFYGHVFFSPTSNHNIDSQLSWRKIDQSDYKSEGYFITGKILLKVVTLICSCFNIDD